MRKVKILHCADLHFDTPFKELNRELSDFSKRELLEVFKNIIDLTIEEKVDVLLIAGDVFDNLTVNKNTLSFICRELDRINKVHVFIAPGNHDPYNEKSFYNMIKWQENVHIFKSNMEFKEIEELNLVVWGAGFTKQYEKESLLTLDRVESNKINIMVLHGEISNSNSGNEYNPIYLDQIEKSNMDYIALGHRHTYSGILKSGKSYYAYSGCPQGRGFDEEGSKGVILGDVYNNAVELKFIETCKRRYVVTEIDITGIDNYDDILNKILNSFNLEERQKNLYKIILIGEIKEHFIFKENVLMEKLNNYFYYIKIINKTRIEINLEDLAMDYSVKGRFVAKMLEKLKYADDEEKEVINLALKIGMQCLSEEEVNLNDN